MSKEFDENIVGRPGHNLISKEDISLLKIKLGKNHRKESDWDIIKEILLSHDVLTAEPMKNTRYVEGFHHVLCEEGALYVFTNSDDCERHIRDMNKRDGKIGRYFRVNILPFEDVIYMADENLMDVYIDMQDEPNSRFLIYLSRTKEMKAVMLEKMW